MSNGTFVGLPTSGVETKEKLRETSYKNSLLVEKLKYRLLMKTTMGAIFEASLFRLPRT